MVDDAVTIADSGFEFGFSLMLFAGSDVVGSVLLTVGTGFIASVLLRLRAMV